jgi:hypothetical protein
MGEALTLDGILNSIDAEIIAMGTSGKGPLRGAVVRHGPFTFWGFAYAPDAMTDAGRALFLNTLHYAAKQGEREVLEKRMAKTRHSPYSYLALAKFKHPGFIRTLAQYLPEEMAGKGITETEAWLDENLPYLYARGRRFEVDLAARELGIPNHSTALLEKCIDDLGKKARYLKAHEVLVRYTGMTGLGASRKAWRKWYKENRDYLFFSDIGGYRFVLDAEAKKKGVPTQELRGWSSEKIDYRADPAVARLTRADATWFVSQRTSLRESGEPVLAGMLADALGWITAFTGYPTSGKSLQAAFSALREALKTEERLLSLLEDSSAVQRIFAATYIRHLTRGLPHDFVFDAIEEAATLADRARQALETAKDGKKG